MYQMHFFVINKVYYKLYSFTMAFVVDRILYTFSKGSQMNIFPCCAFSLSPDSHQQVTLGQNDGKVALHRGRGENWKKSIAKKTEQIKLSKLGHQLRLRSVNNPDVGKYGATDRTNVVGKAVRDSECGFLQENGRSGPQKIIQHTVSIFSPPRCLNMVSLKCIPMQETKSMPNNLRPNLIPHRNNQPQPPDQHYQPISFHPIPQNPPSNPIIPCSQPRRAQTVHQLPVEVSTQRTIKCSSRRLDEITHKDTQSICNDTFSEQDHEISFVVDQNQNGKDKMYISHLLSVGGGGKAQTHDIETNHSHTLNKDESLWA